ncbi:MAG: UDP-N-acetylglucosamine--N-acetylmuramyl-(pentapeptide) pyrophosphoryl-undecaprenol N-acetylglucosamine transferase, partial [Akkermansiaceae bacterium]|nr:UDP-N-acetylglucosamine--N-acetylmuramyl-(pentapeptide) pyrophosphoryl-undecaprenol N-acetylglucosamine transferase [Akkermansiaceae bacterium]
IEMYDLQPGVPVVGVFGGSLGSRAINEAVADMVEEWSGPPIQVVHLTGPSHHEAMAARSSGAGVIWRRVSFEESMESFYAACDLVIARAGGAVAELTATGTPAILVPGSFGSGGHQEGNARFLAAAGAAEVIQEDRLAGLGGVVQRLVGAPELTTAMAEATRDISKPDAARTIARKMIESTK